MAKQLYIDENGNPIEVSGTINTAELLPISANDPTNTKDYIDSFQTVQSGTFTAQANVTVGSKNAVYKQGHWVFINLVLVCGANIPANTNLAQTSINLGSDIYIPTLLEPEKMIVLKSNGNYISTDFNIANSSILRIGTTIYVP